MHPNVYAFINKFFFNLLLQLHDNLLESLPEETGSLTKLRKLNLSSNKLKSLPGKFFSLPELRCLDLKSNLLKELSPAIGDLVMLEYLVWLSYKLIAKLHYFFRIPLI